MSVVEEGVGSEPHLVVVWADPGVTTGWCVLRVAIKRLLTVGQVAATPETWWRIGQYRSPDTSTAVDGFLALARAAWEKAGVDDVVVLGSEGFTLRMQSTDPRLLEPVRFNAVLADRLRGTGVVVETQSPSEAKTTITDARLRLWDLWKPGIDHGRDAQRHALLFLRRFAGQQALREKHGWVG